MSDLNDTLVRIERLSQNIVQQGKGLRAHLNGFMDRLHRAVADADASVVGGIFPLTPASEDDVQTEHGYWLATRNGVSIGVVDTFDYLVYGEEKVLRFVALPDVPDSWLPLACSSEVLSEFSQTTEKILKDKRASVEATGFAEMESQVPPLPVVTVATAMSFERVTSSWQSMQATVHSNPDAAIREAVSLVETTCKHILVEVGQPIPTTGVQVKVANLYRTATEHLGTTNNEQALLGAFKNLLYRLAEVRNRGSDGHGKAPDYTPSTTLASAMAVEAAGTISLTLMKLLQRKKLMEEKKASSGVTES